MGKEVIDYYDSIASDYDNSRFNNSYGQFIDAEERKIMNKLLSASLEDEKRLDMACGTGRLTNFATHGLDASKEMMSYAKKRHPKVVFHQASACDTGFDDNMFDVVYTFHFLMHIDNETIKQVFDEVHRILKPGGRFIFDIPSNRRRRLLHHKQSSWHGATAMDKSDVVRLAGDRYELSRRYGIMILPVHKLPVKIRKTMQRFDYALANSFLKGYSSYQVFELIKKN